MIIALALSVLMTGPVFAETRVPAGTVIEEGHLRGTSEDVEKYIGRQAKRTFYPGKPVAIIDTKEADLVERNSFVRIIGRKGLLRIETKGRALGAGPRGKEIRVLNLESKRTVIGTIIAENTVEVDI